MEKIISMKYLAAAGFLIVILLLLVFLLLRKFQAEVRSLQKIETLWDKITVAIKPEHGLEQILSAMLIPLAELVLAPGYYFYILDAKEKRLVLRSVRSVASGTITGEVYSNLINYFRGEYSPPLGLQVAEQPHEVTFRQEGSFNLLIIPVLKDNPRSDGSAQDALVGLITAGPVKKVSPSTIKILRVLSHKLGSLVELLKVYSHLHEEYQSLTTVHQASSILPGTFGSKQMIDTFFQIGMQLAEAEGGILLSAIKDDEDSEILVTTKKEISCAFFDYQKTFWSLVKKGKPVLLNSSHAAFSSLPGAIINAGIQTLTFFPAQKEAQRALLVYWYTRQIMLDGHQIAAITLVSQRIAELLSVKFYFEEISNAYLQSLKTLVESMDAREPVTVSNSSRVARYAKIIASEMELARGETETVALAAYLRDIGMSGIRRSLLSKKSRFTPSEQESMRLHTEAGAVLAQSLPNSENLAAYIRHHHERWDGWGYPAGLKGEEIPLGARIIAVADTFNALVSNRPYRPAQPFGQALESLKAAAGNQLDPVAVNALVNWFSKKQKEAGSGSLEPCWEMIQCPAAIASRCPAYGKSVNCWTVPGTFCVSHGHSCESCLVYTEYQFRTRVHKA